MINSSCQVFKFIRQPLPMFVRSAKDRELRFISMDYANLKMEAGDVIAYLGERLE